MKTTFRLILVAVLICTGFSVYAQQPVLNYALSVNLADTSSVQITMRVRNLPKVFHVAMVSHFLVDDAYWRFVEDLQISQGTIVREQDGLWRVTGAGNDATVRYKVSLNEKGAFRVVRKPFLTPTGGMVGDLHHSMYVVEATQTPVHVTLQLPPDWNIATSLVPTSDPHTFFARDAKELSDSPILVGRLRESGFQVEQVPIRVAYWPLPDAQPFDEKPLVDGLQRIVQQAANLFGGVPWREYVFQIRDGTDVEGFEHTDCTTIGVPSKDLVAGRNPDYVMITHEFFHTWNIMRIHSAEYKGVSYKPVALSGLWVSEGFTVYFADLLVRRAGLPTPFPTRLAYLEDLIEWYLANPENAGYSAEQNSRGAFKPPIGDAHPDRYVLWEQSELMAALLDLNLRAATNGTRSLDDLMRALYTDFAVQRGFTTTDIERLASKVSGRNLKPFFDEYVRRAGKLDVARYLAMTGLQMETKTIKATAPDGTLKPDTRIYALLPNGESKLRLYLTHQQSTWLRAGLRNGDQLLKFNDSVVETESEFNDLLNALHVGDRVKLQVIRADKLLPIAVEVESYDWPDVKLVQNPAASQRQKAILASWQSGQ